MNNEFEPRYTWAIISPATSDVKDDIVAWKERVSKTDGKLKDLFNLVAWNALDGMSDWASENEVSKQPTETGIMVDVIRRKCGLYKVERGENEAPRVHKWNPIYSFLNSEAAEWEKTMVYPVFYMGVPSSVWDLWDNEAIKWVVILPSMETIPELNKLAHSVTTTK